MKNYLKADDVAKPIIFLRRLTDEDAERYHKISHSSEDIRWYVPFAVFNTLAETTSQVHKWSNADFQKEFVFAITLMNVNGKSKVIGTIWADMSKSQNSVSICYFMANKYREHGYTKKAVSQLLRYLHENTWYDSALFYVEQGNEISKELVVSLGGQQVAIIDEWLGRFYQYEILL